MTRVEIVPAAPDHVAHVAANMRAADRAEIAASSGLQPADALEVSLKASVEAWSGTVDGEPVCMFGVVSRSIIGGVGYPWLLGTDEVERHAVAFLRRNRPFVERWLSIFPRLENFVDVRNEASLRWLGWLRFSFDEPQPWGRDGLPFRRFWMTA